MKYYISLFMVMILSVTTCFSATSKYARNLNTVETINNYENVSYEDIQYVAREYVPEQYQNAFFKFTTCETEEETKDLTIQILAIGYWESGWSITKGNRNDNGTYDIGYLALNTANINNESFMNNFGLKDSEYVLVDNIELYLIVCINFYKYLYDLYGADAPYCYNCGEGKYINENIPSSTYRYTRRIDECVGKFIYESDKRANERIAEEKKMEETIAKIQEETSKIFLKCDKVALSRIMDYISKNIGPIFETGVSSFVYYKNRKEEIDAEFKEVGKPNKDFICIGYIRKYGNLVAPVFQNIKTGEKFIC